MKVTNFEVLAYPYDGEDEAIASALVDNHSMWLKFVFTDDSPNLNKQGISQAEFDNIIRTGQYKPFKKSGLGIIGEGHEGAVPIGTLVDLRHEENKVVAIASVWEDEFPDEATLIRTAYAAKQPLGISWELLYSDTETDSEGVEWLKGITTRAATLLSNPAYGERTPVLAVAADWTTKYKNDLPDSAFLYVEPGGEKDGEGKTTPRSLRHFPYKDANGNIDLPHLRNAIARIPQSSLPAELKSRLQAKARRMLSKQEGNSSMDEVEKLQKDLDAAEAERDELKNKLAQAENLLEELDALKQELTDLRSYKTQVEEDKARNELIKTRLGKFSEAGIEMSEEDFMQEADKWLNLDDDAFGFVLQTLINAKPGNAQASHQMVETSNESDPVGLVKEYLRSRKTEETN